MDKVSKDCRWIKNSVKTAAALSPVLHKISTLIEISKKNLINLVRQNFLSQTEHKNQSKGENKQNTT